MNEEKSISGFSKLSRGAKAAWLQKAFRLSQESLDTLITHLHTDPTIQDLYEEFSENTLSNFYLPYGIIPNVLINGKWLAIPMAIEESSVVAAASHSAKFWSKHGGFQAEVLQSVKVGQVHFSWTGDENKLEDFFIKNKSLLFEKLGKLTSSMEKRGGGILSMELINKQEVLNNYFQLHLRFKTADAMGANFINSVLEKLASEWEFLVGEALERKELEGKIRIDMAILSNYTPESIATVTVQCPIEKLGHFSDNLSGKEFAEKFVYAIDIAKNDVYRAVTHNKGIFNGMDGVVIATGNDFRAVEACGHAYAARDGQYRSLSTAEIKDGIFTMTLEVAMAVGTVGGLTSGHPLAKISLEILDHPSAEELMMIIATAGLANNFSAVRALISSGIQQGHMKMHMSNILRQLAATEEEKAKAQEYFKEKTVSYQELRTFIEALRK